MAVPGAIYRGRDSIAAAIYGSYGDIYSALPKPMTGKHVMHVSYGFENRRQSVDIYSVKDVDYISKRIFSSKRVVNEFSISKDISNVISRQNVCFEILEDIKGTSVEKWLKDSVVRDIELYCKKPAKVSGQSLPDKYVTEIIPVTFAKYSAPKELLTSGKADFVECMLEANLDFATRDAKCITSFVPSTGNYSFDGEKFTGLFEDIYSECLYCYAWHQHKRSFPKSLITFEKKQLVDELVNGRFKGFSGEYYGKKVKILRFGKRTETGSISTRPQFVTALEACIEAGTIPIIPTKFLEFDSLLVDLLKHSKAKLLYSEGLDDLESGALKYGFDNDWRLEQAIKYRQAGVDSSIYLALDMVHTNILTGNHPREQHILEMAKKFNMPVQLLGMRIPNKNLAIPMTGKSWNQLIGIETYRGMHGETFGGYVFTGNTTLTPNVVNPEIEQMVGSNHGNIRACHHDKNTTLCGSCFAHKGFKIKTKEYEFERIKRTKRKKGSKAGELALDLKFDDSQRYA